VPSSLHSGSTGHSRPQGVLPSSPRGAACLPHLVLRRGARGAHGAEGGGPRPPHASNRPRAPESRVGKHSGSRWGRRRSQGRGNGAAAGTQRGQREPARATTRHRSVPSCGAAIRCPGSTRSPLHSRCSAIRDFPILIPGSGVCQSGFQDFLLQICEFLTDLLWAWADPDSAPAWEVPDPGSAVGRSASPGLQRFGSQSPVTQRRLLILNPAQPSRAFYLAAQLRMPQIPPLARPAPNKAPSLTSCLRATPTSLRPALGGRGGSGSCVLKRQERRGVKGRRSRRRCDWLVATFSLVWRPHGNNSLYSPK
jgi:hypothetical protein